MLLALFGSRTRLASVVAIAALLVGALVLWGFQQAGGAPALAGHQDTGAVLVPLNELNGSGQSGWASLTARGNDTEVVISISAGTMASKVAHIHMGQCDPGLGGAMHGLSNLSGGKSTTILRGVALVGLLTGNVGINTHNDQDPSIATTCGNIPADGNFVTVPLNEQHNSGQAGWATLTARGGDTELVIALSKGTMESKVAHVHLGQCSAGVGEAVTGLTNLVDGVSISLLDGLTLDSLRTGDFGINTHNAQDQSISTACGDIPAKPKAELYFTVVSVSGATIAGAEHRLVLDGHGQFSGDTATGGGSFLHFNDSSGSIPRAVIASGTWRVTKLVKWTPHGGSYGGITPGVLDLLAELVPERGPAITHVSMRIICNVPPAGLVNTDPETGAALPEGFILTVPSLPFYPEPFGPFTPIVTEGGVPFGLTTIARVQGTR